MSESEYHFWIWMSGPKVWIWIILDCLFLCLNLNIWINKKQSFRYKTNQTTLHSWLLIKNQDQDEEIRIEKKYHWSLGFSDVIRRYSMSERIRPYLDVFRLQIWKKTNSLNLITSDRIRLQTPFRSERKKQTLP